MNEAIALLKADLVWSDDFEAVRPILLKILTENELNSTRLELVKLLTEGNNARGTSADQ